MQNDIFLFYFIYFLFYFYTSLPHAQLKKQLMIFWRELLILKEKASLLPIIFAPSGRMIRRQRGTRTSPVEELGLAIDFLIDNIYFRTFWKLGFPAGYWYTHGHQQCTFVG